MNARPFSDRLPTWLTLCLTAFVLLAWVPPATAQDTEADTVVDDQEEQEQLEALEAVSKLQASHPELAAEVLWLLDYADKPEQVEDVSDKSIGDIIQEKINNAFGTLNRWMTPILFVDVARGVFDPSQDSLTRKLEQTRDRLAAEEAKPDGQLDPSKVRQLKRAEANIVAWQRTLSNKDLARAQLQPRARRVLTDYTALPSDRRHAVLLDKLHNAAGNIDKLAAATIHQIPLLIVFLLLGGVFFTFRYGFVNLRLFAHSIWVIRGKFDNPNDHGEISHFQALTSALSATVGLGNIAGVAIAISQGGAGAVFWMWVVAFFGMSSKFSSCTLAQIYRRISPEEDRQHHKSEHVLGGPMIYLQDGMKDVLGKVLGTPTGRLLAVLFAFFAIMGSLGGANMFQVNQTFAIVGDVIFEEQIENEDELLDRIEQGDAAAAAELKQARARIIENKQEMKDSYAWVGGLVMAILVGVVIVGGIKRIGEVTSKLVPAMCLFYVGVCLIIMITNYPKVPNLLADIFNGAFSAEAISWGGLMGVLVIGIKRGAFSNEAGLGSAAIAHSAAKTNEPVREGVVAMIGPFVDTIIVCTMTALAILITGAHEADSAGNFSNEGVGITASAFSSLAPWLTYLLTIAVFIFAYSTMIAWSYYGERASEYLFGRYGIWPYRIVFLLCVVISPMLTLNNVIDFTDLLILSMAYPNILGMVILSGKVAAKTKDYVRRLQTGEIKPYDQSETEGEPSI